MADCLVIGYGNPLRSDDGLGWQVVREIERAPVPGAQALHAISCQQLTPELMEPISRSDCVIFVDAAQGDEPGAMQARRLGVEAASPAGAVSHHATPEALLTGARELYGRAPQRAWLLTVTAASFEVGQELSAPVAQSVPQVLKRIALLCAEAHPIRFAQIAQFGGVV